MLRFSSSDGSNYLSIIYILIHRVSAIATLSGMNPRFFLSWARSWGKDRDIHSFAIQSDLGSQSALYGHRHESAFCKFKSNEDELWKDRNWGWDGDTVSPEMPLLFPVATSLPFFLP